MASSSRGWRRIEATSLCLFAPALGVGSVQLRWLGTLALGTDGRIIFFPGFRVRRIGSKVEAPMRHRQDFAPDQLTLEKDRRSLALHDPSKYQASECWICACFGRRRR